jgi:hypothetical protein
MWFIHFPLRLNLIALKGTQLSVIYKETNIISNVYTVFNNTKKSSKLLSDSLTKCIENARWKLLNELEVGHQSSIILGLHKIQHYAFIFTKTKARIFMHSLNTVACSLTYKS